MNLLFLIIGGPGVTLLAIIFLLSYLWDRRRGWLILGILVVIIALTASQCENKRNEASVTETADLSPVSDEEVDELFASIDHDLDSIASLPSYRMSGRILDSLGYKIRPTMLFMELDNRKIGDGDLIICGIADENDSTVRKFSMKFVGDPAVYKSVRIIDCETDRVVFSDRI